MTGASRNSKRRHAGMLALGSILAAVGVFAAVTGASAQYVRPGYGNFGRGPSVNIGPSIHYSPNVVPSTGDPVVSSRPPRQINRTFGDPGDPPVHGEERRPAHVVQPGREENHTRVTEIMNLPFDTKIHYIAVHMHPRYQETVIQELRALALPWLDIGEPGVTYLF